MFILPVFLLLFTSIISFATKIEDITTDFIRNYTLKIDVASLQPNTSCFYKFTVLGTKTTTVGVSSQLRFTFASYIISNYFLL